MIKKVHLQMKAKVALHLLTFQNINMFSKGTYKIKIESFTVDQYCNTELATEEKQQLQLTKFTKTQIFTKDFKIHYQNQKVQLNQLIIIKTPILKFNKQVKLFVRLSLLKLEKPEPDTQKIQFAHLTESIVILRFLQNSLCQYYQCNFQQPFLSNLSLLFLCQPIKITIDIKNYKHASEEELLTLKKQVKKLRYNNYLLYNKYKKIMYNQIKYEFSLPKLFVNGEEQMIEVNTNQQKLLNYLILYESSSLTPQQMNYELLSIAQKNQILFSIFTENSKKMGIFTNKLKTEFEQKKIKMHKQFIIKEIYKQRFCEENQSVVKQKLKILKRELQLGNNDELLNNLQLNMQNIYQQSKIIQLPIFPIVLHQTEKRKSLDKITQGNLQEPQLKTRYVFILAHGYQGCPDDLKLLANGFKKRFRRSRYLILKSYQTKMNQEMNQMIKSAVEQITQYLNTLNFEQKQYKLVMVGHSMGGLILRAAANQIPYINNLFCYISLGTPHLGYLQGIKFIIRAGISFFSNLYNNPCLNQLSNKDNSELHNCFMFKLSQIGTLSNFKRVILVSSVHDKYVSWHSARLEMFNKDRLQEFNFIEKQMIDKILPKPSKIERIDRLQIDFKLQNNNIDKFLGRTSHIKLLNDLQFIEILANACLPQILSD